MDERDRSTPAYADWQKALREQMATDPTWVPATHEEAVATWDGPGVDTRRHDAWMKARKSAGTCAACACVDGKWDRDHCTAPDCRCHRRKG